MSSIVVSLRNANEAMSMALEQFGIDEPDLAAGLVQQIATAVINHNQTWLPTPRLESLYEQVAQVAGCHIDRAAAICREVDDLIATEIVRFIPDYGGGPYRGIVSHAFVPPISVRIAFRAPVATDAPAPPPTGSGTGA